MSSALRRPVASERQSERICRGCGCTDSHACPDGCSWVLLDIETPSGICSPCAIAVDFDTEIMGAICCDTAAEWLGLDEDAA